MTAEFDSKNNCWICLRPYVVHTDADWEKCTAENAKRGKVIDELADLIEGIKKE